MRETKRDKSNLERFGCMFREGTGAFDIDWKRRPAAQAPSATIFARLANVQTKTGPIVLLAFEISPVRPLPNYCYFPFDLKRKGHREYLSRLTKTGEIRLSLLTDKGSYKRAHRLTPYLQSRAAEIYADAFQAYSTIDGGKYDFDSGLALMERHVRVPELLNRLLLEDTLRELSGRIDEAIQTVPSENIELARDCVRVAAEAFIPYYRNHGKTLLDNLGHVRSGLTCIIDLHRMFADNPEGLTRFLSNGLAATLSRQDLGKLAGFVQLVVSIPNLPFKEQSSATESISTIPEIPAGLLTLLQSIATSGISKDAASKVLGLIGLEVGGKPGRHIKDYSREYELTKRLSWRDVARQSLRENSEIREEFGGRNFDSLSFEEKENLKNRIREGVRSYAKRTGKPFPIKRAGNPPESGRPAEK